MASQELLSLRVDSKNSQSSSGPVSEQKEEERRPVGRARVLFANYSPLHLSNPLPFRQTGSA